MSGFASVPNQIDFTTFLVNVVGIDPAYLPPTAPVIGYAFTLAMALVNTALACAGANLYALAVYNLGADQVINFAPDQPGRTYFADLRKAFGANSFVPGVISSSGDGSDSTSLLNPEFMKTLTIMDMQNLRTPYGRQYLAIAQQYGTIWGIS